MKFDLYHTPLRKITLNLIPDSNVRPHPIKLLEENTRGKPLDSLVLAHAIKTKINKWDYIKMKCFFIANETTSKMKRQHKEWEKIFANYLSDKGLTFKNIKNSYNKIVHHHQSSNLKMIRGTE